MPRTLIIAGLFVGALAGAAAAQSVRKEPDLKPYASKEYRYKTYFPEKDPKVTTKKLKTEGGQLTQAMASIDLKDATYSVTVTVVPDAVTFAGKKAVYDATRDGIKGKDGTLKDETDVEQVDDKNTGREMVFEFRRNYLKTRVFLVENRLYQVTVTGPKTAVLGDAANRFFSSFEFTKS